MLIKIQDIKVNNRIRGLDNDRVTEIASSIKEIGLLNPITISEDNVLIAGLHRLRAVTMLGHNEIEANVVSLSSLDQELAEIDENLMRYDLKILDRGHHLKRRKEIYEKKYPETKARNVEGHISNYKTSAADSATEVKTFVADTSQKTNISPRVIREEIQLASSFTPEIEEQIEEADITKTEMLVLARQPEDKHKEILDRSVKEHKKIEKVVKDIKREDSRAKIVEAVKTNMLIPDGKFDIILADPPWRYDNATPNRLVENHYPTMDTSDICKMSIPSNETSILFLWATSGKLPDALEVMRAWGYEYKSSAVWNKMIIGMGYYFRGQHEFLLVGTKGNPGTPEPENRYSSIIEEKRTEHSKKPDIVYGMIEKMYPNRKYLELFARSKHSEAWEVWGNQL